MTDFENSLRQVIADFSALIKSVILTNVHKTDGIEIEDIEQEIKIKIWKLLMKGKKVKNLSSYIKKVAYSATVDELRKMKTQVPAKWLQNPADRDAVRSFYSSREPARSPQEGLEWEELKTSLRTLIDGLGEDRKSVLLLYAAGMSLEEICEFCRWDKVKVRHLLYRGIDDLREKMGRRAAHESRTG